VPYKQLTHHLKKLKKSQKEKLALLLVFFAFIVLVTGTFISVQLAQNEQDIRQQAFNPTGTVEITYQAPATAVIGQPTTISFRINTNGTPLFATQLLFQLTGSFSTRPTVDMSGIPAAYDDLAIIPVEAQNDQGIYTVGLGVLNPPGGVTGISFDPNTLYGTVTFTPSQAGTISINFKDVSKATRFDNQADELKTLTDFTILAEVATTITPTATPVTTVQPTNTPVATPVTTVQPTNTPVAAVSIISVTPTATINTSFPPIETPTPTNTVQPTHTPLPTATEVPGLGGIIVRQCGESCSSNVQCAINLMCYNSQCRRANNPTDQYCNEPPDNGLQRTCNEYCADSRECSTGYTCYYNRCRNPQNLNSTTCSYPAAIAQNNTSTGSTSSRTTTRTNSPTPRPTIKALPTATVTTVQNVGVFGTPRLLPNVGAVSPTPTTKPKVSVSPVVTLPPNQEDEQSSMLDQIQNTLQYLLIAAGVIAGIIFLLWLLSVVLGRKKNEPAHLIENEVDMNKFAGQLKPKNPNDARPRDMRDEG